MQVADENKDLLKFNDDVHKYEDIDKGQWWARKEN